MRTFLSFQLDDFRRLIAEYARDEVYFLSRVEQMPAGVSSAFRTELPAYRSRRKKTRLPWPRHGFLSRQVRSRLISGGFQLRCLLHFVSSHSERRVFTRVGGFFFFSPHLNPMWRFALQRVKISKISFAHNFCDVTTWDAINLPSCNAGCHIFFCFEAFFADA